MHQPDAKSPARPGEGAQGPNGEQARPGTGSDSGAPVSSEAQRADDLDLLGVQERSELDGGISSGTWASPRAERAPEANTELFVVGVGASAGGLDALEQFFGAMPEDTGMAFVVIQHLSPDFKSVMDELLARRTKIPVVLVEDGMRVEPNRIYLIPPKKEMIISGGRLLLSDKGVSQQLMLPIDVFFRSLAQDLGERAVGIVLSGAGSDGARGIRDIHEAGGLVLCQDETSAYFDGMPRSARETGVVDFVLPPPQMPKALLDYARNPEEQRPSVVEHAPNKPYGVAAALRFLQDAYGIDFTHYKPSTVVRRIERRLQLTQSGSLDAYVERLTHDPAELDDLFHDLLIGVTRFFRDEGAFEILEEQIIPELVERARPSEELRVWVAGCATGEEAYSVAILMQEELRKRDSRSRLKILATDLHRGSLDFASRGLYTADRVNRVRPDLLERYFDKRGPNYQVSPELRQCVVFAPHNVIKDAPFTRLDLVTCRNLLIYLQPLAQKKVLGLLHFALKRNGVLVLGPSEHVGPLVDDFEAVDVHWRIYRKHRDLRQGGEVTRLSAPPRSVAPTPGEPRGSFGGYSLSQTVSVYDSLLDEYMPPSLLVNERRELIHTFSGASRYLKVREGRPSNDVLDMVGPDLKMAVTGAMQRALKERTAVTYTGLSLTVDGAARPHRLLVKPVSSNGAHSQHVLVTIDPMDGKEQPPPCQSELDISAVSRDQLGSLEAELRRTKESLQATIEELETSNEELQATNEELLASNEELQSTNEELQSVNEELYTVNAEYQKKIGELTELTNDMDHLLASIQVGTIFLDEQLCIRKFTPLIAEVFSLLPQDVGRPIAGFSSNLNQERLMDDLTSVLRTERSIEREVCDREQNWFFQRILPYRTRGGVQGVVLTLIDISPLKAAENAVFRERYLLDSLMSSVPDAIYFKDAEGRFVRVNQAMALRLGLSEASRAVGRRAKDFLPEPRARALDTADEQALTGQPQPYRQEQALGEDGQPGWFMSTRQPLRDGDGQIVGMLAVSRDINEQKRIEEEIRLAVRRRDEFLAMLSHELRNPLAAIVNAGLLLRSDSAAPSIRQKGLQVIERQSRQMTRLLDDLLEVSRITQGKIELRKQVIDARQVASDAVVALRDRFSSRGIELVSELGTEPVPVEADPARLQQIIVNLLDNAAKYTAARFPGSRGGAAGEESNQGTADGGRRERLPLQGGRAELELRTESGQVVFTITDNGIGIPATLLDTVFEPFVQGAATIHRTEGGMGVGLSVVRSLVNMHDGSITVASDGPDTGTSFSVRLPLATKGPVSSSARRSVAWPGGKRVVVIEDNPDGAEMLTLLLEHAGYEVFTAEDGKRGVELIERVSPNVALVDIGLPVMDGFEVARWVRASSRYRDLYLLALTGYGQAGDRAAALAAGFDEHLVKPVDAELLRQLMQTKDAAGA